jgi:surface antigen
MRENEMRTLNLTQKPLRVALAGVIGLSVVGGGAAIADAASGTVHTASASLSVRKGPGTGYAKVGSLRKGTKVTIICQTYGSTVRGTYGTSRIWDKIGTGRYVSDAYVYTGSDGRVAPDCGGSTPSNPGTPSGVIGNNYPYSGQTSGVDRWNMYKGQCTSFAAWRIESVHKVKGFTNQYKGQHWGNANSWDDAARRSGVTVASRPKAGDIAQSDAGSFGHVAYVAKVNANGSFVVEEYNYVHPEHYGTRTVTVGSGRGQFDSFIRF